MIQLLIYSASHDPVANIFCITWCTCYIYFSSHDHILAHTYYYIFRVLYWSSQPVNWRVSVKEKKIRLSRYITHTIFGYAIVLLYMLQQVKQLSALGITVVVTGGKVGEMSLHFLNKYKIMAVRWTLELKYIFINILCQNIIPCFLTFM